MMGGSIQPPSPSGFLVLAWLCVAFLSIAFILPSAAEARAGAKVYVTNQGSDSVSVIDVGTLSVTATVAVGDYPHNVNHSADGRRVLVTNKSINVDAAPSLSIINPETDKVLATVSGIGERIEHVVSTTPERAYVTEDVGENAVAVVNLSERQVTDFIAVGVKPHGLWPSPDGKWLFVPNQLSGTLSKINLSTSEVIAEAAGR